MGCNTSRARSNAFKNKKKKMEGFAFPKLRIPPCFTLSAFLPSSWSNNTEARRVDRKFLEQRALSWRTLP